MDLIHIWNNIGSLYFNTIEKNAFYNFQLQDLLIVDSLG